MKILLYSYAFSPSIGGMETSACVIASELQKLGEEVIVVTDTPASAEIVFPYRVVRCPSWLTLLRIARQSDVILTMPLALGRIAPLLLSRKPIVIKHPTPFVDDSGRARLRDRLKTWLSNRQVNVVASNYMASYYKRANVIGNAYESDLFFNRQLNDKQGILFVGRLDKVKGCDTLIEALPDVLVFDPAVKVTIVGSGPELGALTALSEARGLTRNVTFAGSKRGSDLAALMNQHAILVVPSKYKEPFGIVALEGLACGCKLIVSRDGGLVDACGGQTLTFDNGNVGDLARALIASLEQLDQPRDELAIQAHLEHHRPAIVAERYRRVLRDTSSRTSAR